VKRKTRHSKLPSIPTTILTGLVLGVIVFFVLSLVDVTGEAKMVKKPVKVTPTKTVSKPAVNYQSAPAYATQPAAPSQTIAANPTTIAGSPCGAGQFLCKNNCYNPKTNNCADSLTGTICLLGQRSCGGTCYTISAQTCFVGNVLCNSGMSACASTCYNPSQKVCANSKTGLLCNFGKKDCGGYCC